MNVETGEGSRLLQGGRESGVQTFQSQANIAMQILIFVPSPDGATGCVSSDLMHFPNFDVDKRYVHWSKISPLVKTLLDEGAFAEASTLTSYCGGLI